MTLMPTIRITADLAKIGSFRTSNRAQSFYLWKENDFSLQLSVFRNGEIQDLSNLSFAIAEIKPLSEAGFSPDLGGEIIAHKKLLPDDFDNGTTAETWFNGSRQQLNFHFSSKDLSLPLGDCWLVVWGEIATNHSIVTLAAGRITFLASALSRTLIDSADGETGIEAAYTRDESDRLFSRREHNLADLQDTERARENLGLRSAAIHELLDEDDLHSASAVAIPTQKNVKTYVDEAIASLAEEIGKGDKAVASDFLWPANASLNFWHAGISLAVPTGSILAAADRWYVSHLNSPGTRVLREALPADPDNYAITFSQRAGGIFDHPISCYYPLTVAETKIFRGKEITIAFDLAKERSQVAGETIVLKILANRAADGTHQKLDIFGSYGSTGEVLQTIPITGLTNQFQRHWTTVEIPEDITQICFQFAYSASPTSLGTGIVLKIARCRIDFGNQAQPYRTPDFREEYQRLLLTNQFATIRFSGTLTEGKKCALYHQFALPFRQRPVCLLARDNWTSEGVNAAAIADISAVDEVGFTIERTPKTAASYGSFESIYHLALPFWE